MGSPSKTDLLSDHLPLPNRDQRGYRGHMVLLSSRLIFGYIHPLKLDALGDKVDRIQHFTQAVTRSAARGLKAQEQSFRCHVSLMRHTRKL